MKTAMQELIEWMDDNKAHCTYGTIRAKATELNEKSNQEIKDAFDAGYSCGWHHQVDYYPPSSKFAGSAEDYFTQKYNQ